MSDSFLTIPIRGQKFSLSVEVQTVLARVETDYQTLEVVDTECFGKILLLDGHVQLASLDERAYHETLVHVPMLSLENPKRALVVGGGDGGVLRELCKHKGLERIDMVEIDERVVLTCREFLPEISGGAFEDPRVRLHILDAFGFMRRPQEERGYDLIVLDITDVYEGEDGALSEQLFTAEFYGDCRNALAPSGLLATQADNPVFCPYSMEAILSSLKAHFKNVGSYQAIVPSFGGFSGFVWAGQVGKIGKDFPQWKAEGLGLSYINEATWRIAFQDLGFSPQS